MSGKRQDGIRKLADIKDRCRIDSETGCWVWAGATKATSARVWLPGGELVSMARALQLVIHGTEPTPERQLVPTCGRTNCGNPAHRVWGTRSDLFRILKPAVPQATRARMAISARAKRSKLDEAKAAQIRVSDESLSVLAERYGVHFSLISRIRNGKAWAPVAASSVFAWRGV